ncbi:MAG: rod shape-determining protein MreD [Solirubrobacterales bacterium]|nr:rod shape-determining protein MreD [Solirubrobacterales bacterium]
MILTRSIIARLVALGMATAILQLSFAAKLSIFGASPDLAVLVVISLGLLGGSVPGAVAGFSIGLLIDTLLFETMGATALTLLTAGYVAGRYRESVGKPNRTIVAALGGGLTLMAALIFAAIQAMLRVGADVSPLVARDILVTAILGVALALPVHMLIRRILRPALIDEAPRASRPVTPSAASDSLAR